MCTGGTSFDQLRFLKDNLHINDGLVLNNGQISFRWQNVMFWRTIIALYLHMLSLLVLQGLSSKLGFFENRQTITYIEEIKDRPSEDTITAYSFFRQPFYHKAVAANSHEKEMHHRRSKHCLC